MARLAMVQKALKEPKFSTRRVNRCLQCGRVHAVYRDFGLCRICLRKYASLGMIPGMTKASW
jgi:small subunit ribosomal protein S14